VVVDVYDDTAVLVTYAAGAEALGRLAAAVVQRRLGLARLLWKPAHRRAGPGAATSVRALRGGLPAGPIRFRERHRDPAGAGEGSGGALDLWVDPVAGQKSGAYLDLRGLRRWLVARDLGGRRVLNLFSYTGALGLAAERAGASEVWNVDSSQAALDFGARHHAGAGAQRAVHADVFEWLPALAREERFDLVIADPPPMTSRMEQAERALRAYRRLYRAAAPHVAAGGRLVACCCTSRIDPRSFRRAVSDGLGAGFELEQRLRHEVDHPVRFPEADYLKILVFRRVDERAISGGV
jgi:23S rRNA (cytosine1962-C5)-methyltransferase